METITEDQVKMLLNTLKNLDLDENRPVEIYNYDEYDYIFKSLNIHGLKQLLETNKTLSQFDSSAFLDSPTDLIAGVYEGGLKIWESSLDLLEYLLVNDLVKADQKVCDIGCGSGLLGILGLKKNASLVHFLDYNREVLQWFTLPNILNNLITNTDDELLDFAIKKSGLYSGDWTLVDQALADTKYDLILTSETIYCKDNYTKLLNIIKNHLNPNGVCFVAAKVYYFGLNGGCFEFIEFVKKDATFNIDVVKTIEANLQRKILKLTFNTFKL